MTQSLTAHERRYLLRKIRQYGYLNRIASERNSCAHAASKVLANIAAYLKRKSAP